MRVLKYIGKLQHIILATMFYAVMSANTAAQDTGSFTDFRDGKVYSWVKLGNQTWMSENLAYLPQVDTVTDGSEDIAEGKYYYVYDFAPIPAEDEATQISNAKATVNYQTYGVLYNWHAAMDGAGSSSTNPSRVSGVCPTGWHLPSITEWGELETWLTNNGYGYEGSGSDIAKALADSSLWSEYATPGTPGNDLPSNNSSGFKGLPGGQRNYGNNFLYYSYNFDSWSASEYTALTAIKRTLNYSQMFLVESNTDMSNGLSVRCIQDIDYLSSLEILGEAVFDDLVSLTGDSTQTIYLKNISTLDLVVDSISNMHYPFSRSVTLTDIPAGDSLAVNITLDTGIEEGTFSDSLVIYLGMQDTTIYINANIVTGEFSAVDPGIEGITEGELKWGDYDNDGDLDILLTGQTEMGGFPSIIYENDNGTFSNINAGLTGLGYSDTDWGDYDNDGDLDIIITGWAGSYYSIVYRNDNGTFTNINAGLTGVRYGSADWGDFDNDGDLDILLTGLTSTSAKISFIYRNDDGNFAFYANITGVSSGVAEWADFDNDGDLDILLSGQGISSSISYIYRNDDGLFNVISNITALSNSATDWGDYDNDGDLDIILTGYSGGSYAEIFNNDNGTFTGISADITAVYNGSADWGDYDNDGDLDILITGYTGSDYISHIYNNNNGNFIRSSSLEGVRYSSAAWGDYDNDGDLDIILTGQSASGSVFKIYRNNCITPNSPPSAPSNLSITDGSEYFTLSWDASADIETPQDGLSYNYYLFNDDGADTIQIAAADISTGYNRIPERGKIQGTSARILNPGSGTYTWGIQAIDAGFTGSEFASTTTTVLNQAPEKPFCDDSLNYYEVFTDSVVLGWHSVDYDGDVVYYNIYCGPEGEMELIADNVTQDSIIIRDLIPGKIYYWQIVAFDEYDASATGDIWYFKTANSETEPNNSFASANCSSNSTGFYGAVGNSTDEADYFCISLPYDALLAVKIENLNMTGLLNGGLGTVIIYDSQYSTNASVISDYLDAGEEYTTGKIMLNAGEKYYIRILPELTDDNVPYRISFFIDSLDITDFPEPNNTMQNAYHLFHNEISSFTGFMKDDADWYSVSFNGEGTFAIWVTDPDDIYTIGGGLGNVYIYNKSGVQITSIPDYSINNGQSSGSGLVAVSAGQNYYIKLSPYDNFSAAAYKLEIISDVLETTEGWQPSVPQPLNIPDMSTNIMAGDTTIIWQSNAKDGGPLTYKLYLGNINPPPLVTENLTANEWQVNGLEFRDTVYWQVSAADEYGNVSTSPVYSFRVLREGYFIDSRDGNEYDYITIGNQTWMAENLAYLPAVSPPHVGSEISGYENNPFYYVYNNWDTNPETAKNTYYHQTYGVLYNWWAAMNGESSSSTNPSRVQGVCPAGWHLPSVAEWEEMANWLTDNGYGWEGSGNDVSKSLAYNALWWVSSIPGTIGNILSLNNKSGFSALPGGYRSNAGTYYSSGSTGLWWSSQENGSYLAYSSSLFFESTVLANNSTYQKYLGHSVRCIRDYNYLKDLSISGEPEFGFILQNSGDTIQTVYIKNNGPQEIIIDSIPQLNTPFNRALSLTNLTPGDSLAVNITLNTNNPTDSYADTLRIYISSQDTAIALSATLVENMPVKLSMLSPADNEHDVDTLGTLLKWYGDDFEGESISYNVYFGTEADPVLVSAGQTDTFYVLPQLSAASAYYWYVSAGDTYGNVTTCPVQRFTTWTNDPVELTLLQPDDNTNNTGISIDLKWMGFDDENEEVTFDVYFGREFNPPLVLTGITGTIVHIDTLSWGCGYYWKVTANDGVNLTESETRYFFTGINDPPLLTLLGPEDSSNVGLTVELAWSATDDEGEDISYDVYFGTNSTPEPVHSGFTDNTLLIDTLDWETTYYWKIVAFDTYGNFTESAVLSCYTTTDQAPVINNIRPPDQETETGIKVNLEWEIYNDDNDSVYYEFYFGSDTSPLLIESDSTLQKEFSVYIDTLQFGNTYYWKLKAADRKGHSTETSVLSFSTGLNDPPLVTLVEPANDITGVQLSVDLIWSAADDEDDDITYDIRFGRTYPPAELLTDYSDTVLTIDTLSYSTLYYWQIIANDSYGNSSSSEIISITTILRNFTDARDNNEYDYMTYGRQTWMAENLRYLPAVSPPDIGSEDTGYENYELFYVRGYSGTDINTAKATEDYQMYGVFYNWYAAMNGESSSNNNPSNIQGVCPDGWHLPSGSEWTELETWLTDNGYGYGGSGADIGKAMASSAGWIATSTEGYIGNNQPSNNSSLFSALPAGGRQPDNFFTNGWAALFWSASEYDLNTAVTRDLYYDGNTLGMSSLDKYRGHSVRCVKDIDYISTLLILGDLNFGYTLVNTGTSLETIYIKNTGSETISITDIPQLNEPFSRSGYQTSITAGDSVAVNVSFNTSNPLGLYTDTLFIYIGTQVKKIAVSAILVENIPVILELISPAQNAYDVDTIGTRLVWIGIDPEEEQITYDVYFGTASSPPMVSEAQTDTFYILPQLAYGTEYFWYITARDAWGNVTTSNTYYFTSWTNDAPSVLLRQPANNSTDITTDLNLIWSARDDEDDDLAFDIYLGTAASPPLYQSGSTDTIFKITNLQKNTIYYWKIVARDGYGNFTESILSKFTTTNKATGWINYKVTDADGEGLADVHFRAGTANLFEGFTDAAGYTGQIMLLTGINQATFIKPGCFSYFTNNIEVLQDQITTGTVILPPVADYNGDGNINQTDIDSLVVNWRAEDYSYEMGPASGIAPDYLVSPDGNLDFEDLMIFGMMWDYKNDSKSNITDLSDNVSYIHSGNLNVVCTVEENENSGKVIMNFKLNVSGNLLSNKLVIYYDNSTLRFDKNNNRLPVNLNSISFINDYPEEGCLEIYTGILNDNYIENIIDLVSVSFEKISKDFVTPRASYETHTAGSIKETGIVRMDVKDNIIIYPNPANDMITIELGDSGIFSHLKVISSNGTLMLQKELHGSKESIDISVLKSGMYIFVITNNYNLISKIIIKQ